MANFSAKYSIMTQEMVDSFCESFYISGEVHPTAPGRNKTIAQFPAGKVGIYTRFFDVCGYRIPFIKFFMAVLKYFRVYISQLSPFGAARLSHFEVLTRVLNLAPPVTIFRAFYTRSYNDVLFSFAKRYTSALSFPLYTGGILEKDQAPHLTARQEQTVKLLEIHKAPFRRYPKCFLCLVGLSPYYPFDENSYPAFEYPDGTEMGLLDFIKTTDLQKVQAVEVQKKDKHVKLLESTQHCFMPLKPPASRGSSYVADAEVPAPAKEETKVVAAEDAYLELADQGECMTIVRQGEEEVVEDRPKKAKRKRLVKQSDILLAKKLRADHPSLASGTRGKTLAGLEQIMPAGSCLLAREPPAIPSVAPPSQESGNFVDLSAQASLQIHTTVGSSSTLIAPADTTTAAATSLKATATAKHAMDVNPDLAGPSQLEESKGSDDSFYEPGIFDPSEAKRWSRAEHELELKEKLRLKYAAREKSALTAKVLAHKVTITQKDHDISLLDSRATHLALASEVSSLHVSFQDFKEKIEAQQEEQAQELYDRVAELEAHVMDVSGHLGGGFYPTYLTLLAERRWLLTIGIQLALLKCLKSSEYQGILGHDLGRAVDFGMQEGLEAGHEHGVAGRSLFVVDAYNLEVARANYVNAVKALEDAYFPLVDLLKSKKEARMDELSIPIHHARDKTAVGETSLSFALMNVHARAEGAKKHAVALRQLMMEIVSAPLSSHTWVGEASIFAAPLSVEDNAEEDTDEALGSVVAVPNIERF
ncbi:hypothetical protein Tco_0291784 [Tanacetum coccineum]